MVNTADFFTVNTYMKYATIPASVIILILTLLQKRTRPNPCGYYLPGIVVPMRFLDGYEDRWSYALAFGTTTGIIVSVFVQQAFSPLSDDTQQTSDNGFFCGDSQADVNDSDSACDQVWVNALELQAQTLVGSLVCAPPFVCLSTPYRLLGAVMGFSYCVYWVVFYIVGAVQNEKYHDYKTGTLLLLRDLPVVVCFLGLCLRSIWSVYICYSTRTVRVQKVDTLVEVHQVDHVASLFRPLPPEEPAPEGLLQSVKEKAKVQLFPYFKLPTRIICIAFVQVIIIYYMVVTVSVLGINIRRSLKALIANWPNNGTIVSIFDGVYVTSVVLGLMSSAAYVALFVINYRINMINVYKGKKNTYMDLSDTSVSKHVASSLRLPGYQIAYTLWGFVVIVFMLAVLLGSVCFGIYALNELDALVTILQGIAQSLSVPLTTIAFFYLQVLLVRKYLLQPKLNEGDKHHPLNINNRHVYEVVAYTLVFINLLVGLVSALFRTFKSLLLGLLFLARLDRCLLMRGFETMDPGYMAYVGTLLVDNAHNNPVMRTFCAVLVRLAFGPDFRELHGVHLLPEPSIQARTNSRAVRRWHLAYTLLKNPDLLPRRKLALLLARGIHDDDDDNGDDDSVNKSQHRHQSGASVSGDDDGYGAVVVVRAAGEVVEENRTNIFLQPVLHMV